jgi:hypothetical protein
MIAAVTTVAAIVVVVAAHELAHALMALALGLPIRLFFRIPVSAGIGVIAPASGLPPAHDLAIALAGPVASLAMVWPLWMFGLPVVALASGFCGVATLVPLRPQDGWRALEALRLLQGDVRPAVGEAEIPNHRPASRPLAADRQGRRTAQPTSAKTITLLHGALVPFHDPIGSNVNTALMPRSTSSSSISMSIARTSARSRTAASTAKISAKTSFDAVIERDQVMSWFTMNELRDCPKCGARTVVITDFAIVCVDCGVIETRGSRNHRSRVAKRKDLLGERVDERTAHLTSNA